MRISKILFSVAACLFVFSAVADLPWFAHGPKRQVVTLVVTGNYKSPRLMAELIQNESRQPYLLLPAQGSGDDRIICCQPKANRQIPEAKLEAFVRFLNPRRIIVLGGENYVPQRYVDIIGKDIPVVRVECTDWQRSAEELNDLLNLNNLASNYRRLREKLLNSSRFYRPTRPMPAKEATVAVVEEKSSDVKPAEEVAPAENVAPVEASDDAAPAAPKTKSEPVAEESAA